MNYPGNIVQPSFTSRFQDDAIIPKDPNQVFQSYNPRLKDLIHSASLVLDHMINDDYQMFVTYAWIDQEYTHSQSLNGVAINKRL